MFEKTILNEYTAMFNARISDIKWLIDDSYTEVTEVFIMSGPIKTMINVNKYWYVIQYNVEINM